MNIDHALTDTITYQTVAGISGGDPTWATARTAKARVEQGLREVFSASGEVKQASHTLYTTTRLPLECRVWLPGASTSDAGASKRPVATKQSSTFGGYTIFETYL